MTEPRQDLKAFFYPENVAVIGVSPEENNLAKNIVRNLLTFNYPGEILPVGIKGGVLFGQRIFTSVTQIDHRVDLAVLLTPAKTIPGLLEECGQKGITRIIIESGGFSELGEKGVELEKACVEKARQYGLRFVGPNGIGITNMENGLSLAFWPMPEDLKRGPVSVLAQSGGVGVSYLSFLAEENIGINKFVSMGNKLDVDENDLLEYLIEDEGTEIILLYLEGFSEGRSFVQVASRSGKPILVHKSNRFKESEQIAHSHTSALSVDDRLVDDVLHQARCVRANTMVDAVDYVKSLTLPPLRGDRLAVVSRSGGHAVIASDACAHYGFQLPQFSREFLKKIEAKCRANVIRLQNPLDLGDLFDLHVYETIIEELLKREDVDGILLGHGYRRGFDHEPSRELIKKVERLVQHHQKPVAVVIFAEAVEVDYLKRGTRIPIFTAPENAMRAFYLSHQWEDMKRAGAGPGLPVHPDTSKAMELVKRAGERQYLRLDESMELIRIYGFPVPEYRLVATPEEAVRAWQELNSPVVMKVNRPHISHKTDQGLVRLGLNSEKDLSDAFDSLSVNAGEGEFQVMVQPLVEEGVEVILGGKKDKVFGPVILFGLGGVFVEAIGDVVWRMVPINRHDAREMIGQIKGQKIFAGMRGEGPVDTEVIEDLLLGLSLAFTELPGIGEIDINPVKVSGAGKGASALDARIILERS